MTKTTARKVYDASMVAFKVVAAAYREAALKYRARKIDDAEFLAAKAALKVADEASDKAEAELLKTMEVE